jgi:hypothetical protein
MMLEITRTVQSSTIVSISLTHWLQGQIAFRNSSGAPVPDGMKPTLLCDLDRDL